MKKLMKLTKNDFVRKSYQEVRVRKRSRDFYIIKIVSILLVYFMAYFAIQIIFI